MRRFLAAAICVAAAGCGDGKTMMTGAAGTMGSMTTGTAGTSGAAGSSGQTWPMVVSSAWLVQLNAGQSPSCVGSMSLTLTQPSQDAATSVSGTWTCNEAAQDCTLAQTADAGWVCIAYAGNVTGSIELGSNAVLTLGTDGTNTMQMMGTMTTSSIIGSVPLGDTYVRFGAVAQQ